LTLSGFAAAAGSNRFLEVWVGTGDSSPEEPTGVTWGGQAMTKRGTAQAMDSFWYHVKYFIKEADFPGGATGDIVASWGPAIDDRTILALVHADVDQTNPYRNGSQTVENDGSTATPSIDVASNADDVVTAGILVVDSAAGISSIANSAGTERADTGPVGGGYEVASCATVPGATTATITWSVTMGAGTDDHTGMLADSLQGASSGGIGARLSRFAGQPMLRGPF
jgi:hypothetical protein